LTLLIGVTACKKPVSLILKRSFPNKWMKKTDRALANSDSPRRWPQKGRR